MSARTVALVPGAELQRSRLDVTADGTAVVSMQVGSPAPSRPGC
ncbi:hypothetical protein [Klenkia marina]|nr:hypothetical protein [Klenkia marina]